MSQKCEQFQSSLLELAYGELSEAADDELRTHAAACPSCREALEQVMIVRRLASQLPDLDPGESLDAPILTAAQEAARGFSGQEQIEPNLKSTDRDMTIVPVTEAPSLIERIRAFLLTPALATAAVAAVVFVISFFVSEKSPHKGMGQQMDVPTSLTSNSEPAQELVRDPVWQTEKRKDTRTPSNETAPRLGTSDGKSSPRARNLGTAGPETNLDVAEKIRPMASLKKAKRSKKKAILESPRGFSDEPPSTVQLEAPSSKKKSIAPRTLPRKEGSASRGSGLTKDSDNFNKGMAAYDRGDCDAATSAFLKVIEQSTSDKARTPLAIHHIARCEKRRGRCGKALPWYEKLLNRFFEYKGRNEALWEAARCHRRLGHITRARALLEELSKTPSWEARATQETQRLKN